MKVKNIRFYQNLQKAFQGKKIKSLFENIQSLWNELESKWFLST